MVTQPGGLAISSQMKGYSLRTHLLGTLKDNLTKLSSTVMVLPKGAHACEKKRNKDSVIGLNR